MIFQISRDEMTTLATYIQNKLRPSRPFGCPNDIWDKFLEFFPALYKTGEEFPDIIQWCNSDIPDCKCLEISYYTRELTVYIDYKAVEICDHKTGIWYPQSEIIFLWENSNIKTD